MSDNLGRDNRGRNERGNNQRAALDHVHPLVYLAIIGLALWFVLSAWSFAADGYTDWLLVVVSGFILVAVAIPSVLLLVWRNHREPGEDAGQHERLRDWAAGDLDTWQDRVKGSNAAVEMLLPIAAVAFGMTAFGIVFGIVLYLTPHGAV
jgi:hypothetical protein